MNDVAQGRNLSRLLLIAAFAAVMLGVSPFIGMEPIGPGILLKGGDPVRETIFWKIRVPRVLAGFLAGSSLALSGLAFQAVFRNPLATPFTLGVSGGAAFGATLYLQAGMVASMAGLPGRSISAFLGALLSIALVYGLTRVRKGYSTATMLIAGVAINFFFSSMILFMQYVSDFTQTFRIVRWLMGGVETVQSASLAVMALFALTGSVVLLCMVHELNLLTMGDDIAAGRGVDVRRSRKTVFMAASLLVGGVVSVCGPIAFVGMMAPHICRLITGDDHRILAPASFLFGGGFLVLCDAAARMIIAPAEVPVGVITALLGGPFFLWLLVRGASEKSILHGKDRVG